MWHLVMLAAGAVGCQDADAIWEEVSAGCQITGGCFSTVGFTASNYGHNLNCTARLCKDGDYEIHGLSTEAGGSGCIHDALTWKGVTYCGYLDTPSERDDGFTMTDSTQGNLPSTTTGTTEQGAFASFVSDMVDTYHGFEICVTPHPVEEPPAKDESGDDDDGLSDGELAGVIVGAVVGGTALLYGSYRYGKYRKTRAGEGGGTVASVGDLVF